MKLVKALDIDGDSTVNKQDFVQLVTLAKKSAVSTDQFYASNTSSFSKSKVQHPSHTVVIEHMNEIISINNSIGNRTKAIFRSIFQKISVWQKTRQDYPHEDEILTDAYSKVIDVQALKTAFEGLRAIELTAQEA